MKRPFVLIGFMGAGKSAVGRLLAERLGRPFVDLDEEVERRAGRAIAEIFASDGEAAFRRLELEALAEVGDAIVAAGGGLPTQAAARRWLGEKARTCWLDVALDVVRERVRDGASRPLWPEDPVAQRVLYESRTPRYALADYRVDASGEPADVVRRIIDGFPRNLA